MFWWVSKIFWNSRRLLQLKEFRKLLWLWIKLRKYPFVFYLMANILQGALVRYCMNKIWITFPNTKGTSPFHENRCYKTTETEFLNVWHICTSPDYAIRFCEESIATWFFHFLFLLLIHTDNKGEYESPQIQGYTVASDKNSECVPAGLVFQIQNYSSDDQELSNLSYVHWIPRHRIDGEGPSLCRLTSATPHSWGSPCAERLTVLCCKSTSAICQWPHGNLVMSTSDWKKCLRVQPATVNVSKWSYWHQWVLSCCGFPNYRSPKMVSILWTPRQMAL